MSLFADDPINGTSTAPDRLARTTYARHLVALLDRVRGQSESSVLALIGPWGSGKSSLLELMLGMLRQSAAWRIAEFNPWAFADLDSMLIGFFEEIISALPDDDRPRQAKERLSRFVTSISPIGKLGALVGADSEGTLEKIGQMIGGDQGPSAKRKLAVEALRNAAQPILVVLDDLDRLSPTELLLVFKLVRFVGRLPNVFYMLSYDERTLLDVLARTELCGDNERRARDHLEKIVQIRLDLPALHDKQTEDLVLAGFYAAGAWHGLQLAEVERIRFINIYEAHLRGRLTTPRSINRYFAQVDALYTMLADEVDFVDFALLTFVRTFEPALYGLLARLKAELSTAAPPLGRFSREDDRDEYVSRLFSVSGVEGQDASGLKGILTELFPALTARKIEGESDELRLLADCKRAGHKDYFERYFSFAVPEDDLSDGELYQLLLSLPCLALDAPALAILIRCLIADTERTIRKISLRLPQNKDVTEAILDLLGSNFIALSDHGGETSPREIVARFSATLILEDQEAAEGRFRRLAGTTSGLLLALRIAEERRETLSPVVSSMLSISVSTALLLHVHEPFVSLPLHLYSLLASWNIVDAVACRAWLSEHTGDDEWDALDLAGWLINTRSKTSGDGTVETVLHDLPDSSLENYFNLETLLERFESQIDISSTALGEDLPDTPANRRTAVLLVLGMMRDRRRSTNGP